MTCVGRQFTLTPALRVCYVVCMIRCYEVFLKLGAQNSGTGCIFFIERKKKPVSTNYGGTRLVGDHELVGELGVLLTAGTRFIAPGHSLCMAFVFAKLKQRKVRALFYFALVSFSFTDSICPQQYLTP